MKQHTKIIGILNITPDSFSDGGKYLSMEQALSYAKFLIERKVDIIDIGAESTRPDASLITEEEEWKRLNNILPQIIKLTQNSNTQISIDTQKSLIAEKAIKLGVHYINDVSSFSDIKMIDTIKTANVKIIITHNLGIPPNKNITIPVKSNPIDEIAKWAQNQIYKLNKLGIKAERIIIDPGIGFGKNIEQSWYIIKNISKLKEALPKHIEICIGHSRKSFLSMATDISLRDNATCHISIFLLQQHINYIRVHNVELHQQAFSIWNKLLW